jgi:hypothetical protein
MGEKLHLALIAGFFILVLVYTVGTMILYPV